MIKYRMLYVSPEVRQEEVFQADPEQAYEYAYQTNLGKNVIVLWLKVELNNGDLITDDNWRPPKEK